MSGINGIQRLVPGIIERADTKQPVLLEPSRNVEKNEKFTDMFTNMMNSVDGLQKEAGSMQEAFLNGEPVELHQLMIKMEEAGIAMDLLLEVRNKLISAYNEIMRMPI